MKKKDLQSPYLYLLNINFLLTQDSKRFLLTDEKIQSSFRQRQTKKKRKKKKLFTHHFIVFGIILLSRLLCFWENIVYKMLFSLSTEKVDRQLFRQFTALPLFCLVLCVCELRMKRLVASKIDTATARKHMCEQTSLPKQKVICQHGG